ncbi:hypothetical protein SDC9_144451 [bioreactor metagenome]|uniref:Uncharacterized protein n=1 Tax=bioreactor metagenome TaxID=1076179 RepID=A0A645E7S6_9ZZZZ
MLVKIAAPAGVVVGSGGHGQGVGLHQFVAVGPVHPPLHPPQQEGGRKGHGEIARHFNGGGGKIGKGGPGNRLVGGKKVGKADNEHHGGVLDVDNQVVADLGHDVPQGLGQNDAQHGLEVGHADGLGPLRLAGVDGENAASDGLGHIRTGIDGYHQNRHGPDAFKADGVVGEIGQAVVNEHRLQNHGRASENLDINAQQHPHKPQPQPLDGMVGFGAGDGLQNTAAKPDDAAD